MNIPLLRKIQKRLDKNPELFRMEHWTNEVSCGTAYCIGGWAMELSGESADKLNKMSDSISYAADLLGLTSDEGVRLFVKEDWPPQFVAAEDEPELPSLAIARIDHFIATEGRE